MSKKHKKIKEAQLTGFRAREEGITNALQFSKKRFKKFDEVILQLYLERDLRSFFTDKRICKVSECFGLLSIKNKPAERAMLKNVLVYLERWSLLIKEEEFIQAVYNIVLVRSFWRKDIFDWKPVSKHGREQLKELTFFLFCQYAVPDFLYQAFYEKSNMRFIKWFIHIGTGQKLRDLNDLPFEFSQKMGHYFLQAPSKLRIAEALRWAQVKGMNGDDKLAERIAYSWIGLKGYEDEEFWASFLRILINGGMFNLERLTELIDYARESKKDNAGYSLKGRTLQSLMRQSDEWHKKEIVTRGAQSWNACGISEYKLEKKTETVIIEELRGSKFLSDEGRKMKHCVGSYTRLCVSGKTAIFSLRKYSMGLLVDILATIEVSLVTKRIIQAKSKMNRKVSDEARKYIDVWAGKNGLDVNIYL